MCDAARACKPTSINNAPFERLHAVNLTQGTERPHFCSSLLALWPFRCMSTLPRFCPLWVLAHYIFSLAVEELERDPEEEENIYVTAKKRTK